MAQPIDQQSRQSTTPRSARSAPSETAQQETWTLSAEESAAFIEALKNPPAPGAQLRAAADVHREFIEIEADT